MIESPEIRFFETADEFRSWLAEHHETAKEIWVGFWRKGSDHAGITWPQAVDEALCVGWIDGIRKRVDDESYKIRFTLRRKDSTWSAVNIDRVAALTAEGRMRPAGIAAFDARAERTSRQYSYETAARTLDPTMQRTLEASEQAWAFFQAQPAWYRRNATHWVLQGKREDTRARRLEMLIEDSERGIWIPPLRRAQPA